MHPIDIHVGQRVKQQRLVMKITQMQLAEKLNLRAQQIQKYEAGINRISASALWDISKTLDTTIDYFFDGYKSIENKTSVMDQKQYGNDVKTLLSNYSQLPKKQRQLLKELMTELK